VGAQSGVGRSLDWASPGEGATDGSRPSYRKQPGGMINRAKSKQLTVGDWLELRPPMYGVESTGFSRVLPLARGTTQLKLVLRNAVS